MTRVKGSGDTRRRRAQRLLNGSRHPAPSLAPGPVAVPVRATTVPWTGPRPARRELCSPAYHPALNPPPLYWGGGTVSRFWAATDHPDKTDVLVHGYKMSITEIRSRLAQSGLRTHTAVTTTPVGRAPDEDRRPPHTVPFGGAPRDGPQTHDKFHVGGSPLEGRRVPHKAPLGGALLAGRRPCHEVPRGGSLRDGRQAPHAALRGGSRHVKWRTIVDARTASPPTVTDVRVCTPHQVRGFPPGGRRRTRRLSLDALERRGTRQSSERERLQVGADARPTAEHILAVDLVAPTAAAVAAANAGGGGAATTACYRTEPRPAPAADNAGGGAPTTVLFRRKLIPATAAYAAGGGASAIVRHRRNPSPASLDFYAGTCSPPTSPPRSPSTTPAVPDVKYNVPNSMGSSLSWTDEDRGLCAARFWR